MGNQKKRGGGVPTRLQPFSLQQYGTQLQAGLSLLRTLPSPSTKLELRTFRWLPLLPDRNRTPLFSSLPCTIRSPTDALTKQVTSSCNSDCARRELYVQHIGSGLVRNRVWNQVDPRAALSIPCKGQGTPAWSVSSVLTADHPAGAQRQVMVLRCRPQVVVIVGQREGVHREHVLDRDC